MESKKSCIDEDFVRGERNEVERGSDTNSNEEASLVSRNPWCGPSFRPFWRQYYASQRWCRKHWSVSCSLRSQYGNNMAPLLPPPPPPPPTVHTRRKKRRRRSKVKTQDGNFQVNVDAEPANIEEEAEIDEAFVEFLSNSIRHRIERDKEKSNSNDQSWFANLDEYIPVDKIGVNRRVVGLAESLLPPTEVQGQERSREMKVLYGVNSERIHALESLMQVQFDIDFDRLNPPLWPNMPFKL